MCRSAWRLPRPQGRRVLLRPSRTRRCHVLQPLSTRSPTADDVCSHVQARSSADLKADLDAKLVRARVRGIPPAAGAEATWSHCSPTSTPLVAADPAALPATQAAAEARHEKTLDEIKSRAAAEVVSTHHGRRALAAIKPRSDRRPCGFRRDRLPPAGSRQGRRLQEAHAPQGRRCCRCR